MKGDRGPGARGPDAGSVAPLRSALLERHGFRHAFFTRRGGVSTEGYASLNLSERTGDDPTRVAENRQRAAFALALSPAALRWVTQVHGARVLRADDAGATESFAERADAIWSDTAGLGCCVHTADCVPLLLGDPETGRVAAVHAGWRGAVQQVAGAAVAALASAGSEPARLVAAIGPHICLEAFEIGEEVAAQLEAAAASPAVRVVQRRPEWPRPHGDLAVLVRSQLEESGVASHNIDQVAGCTYRDAEDFFSYRRHGPGGGLLMATIVAR